MRLPKLTDLVKRRAEFFQYRDRQLWYRISWCEPRVPGDDEDDRFKNGDPELLRAIDESISAGRMTLSMTACFEFPIPIEDADGGIFEAEDEGLIFMRWIRKHLKYLQDSIDAEAK